MARVVALIDNGWSEVVRLAIPARHAEAITSRPLLLTAGGNQTHHQGQPRLTLTSHHAHTRKGQRLFHGIRPFFGECRATAEQLGWAALWRQILSRVVAAWLKGRALTPPPLIPAPP